MIQYADESELDNQKWPCEKCGELYFHEDLSNYAQPNNEVIEVCQKCLNKANQDFSGSNTKITREPCARCGKTDYCIWVYWTEDYDENGRPLGELQPTCQHCLIKDVHEAEALDLKEFIDSHVYGEGEK